MSKPLSIIFLGTPDFAVPSLEALAQDPAFDVQLVVTQPDRPVGRKKILTPPPVKVAAGRLGLPVWQPENINEEISRLPTSPRLRGARKTRDSRFDYLVVVAYGQILSQAVLDLPAIAPVNVHASLLPRWRGASPVEHAILAGDRETGVTIQTMVRALDAGDILAAERLTIGPRDTTPFLKERLARLGAELLVRTLKAPLRPVPQPAEGVTVCRKLSRADGNADPSSMTAEEIDRRARALNPWPGVTCTVAGRPVKLIETALAPAGGSIPLFCAGGTTLHLVCVQQAGKKAMTADVWKRGLTLALLFTFAFGPARIAAQIPDIRDIDGDALLDTVEDTNANGVVDAGETDPRNADTDDGGEADGSEVHGGRNPLVQEDDMTFDRDGDGLTNGMERVLSTDPANPDTDGDGVRDGTDPFPLERAYRADANKNGLPDEWEQQHQLAPAGASSSASSASVVTSSTNAQTSSAAASVSPAGTMIAAGDPDGDGLTNAQEFEHGTDPRSNDTDRDGADDGDEVAQGRNPEESACLAYDPSLPSLPDLEGHWSKDVVTQLQRILILPARDPVIRGYVLSSDDGTGRTAFLPDRNVTRFEFLKMALYSSCINLAAAGTARTPFPDVPAHRPHESSERAFIRRIVATAVDEEIVHGYPEGLFRPDAPVSRAEALKMLLRATRLQPLPEELEEVAPFPDVPADAWFRTYVEQAYAMQLIEGYADGTFRPHAPITRAEAAKVIDFAMLTNPGVNGYIIPAEPE